MGGFSAATRAMADAAATPTTTPTRDAVDAVLARAGSEITLVDPADGTGWLWPDELAERVTAAAARGCRTRVLFGRWPSAARPRQFARLAAEAGTEIRTGSAPDQAMLAVDGVTALLPSDSRTVAVITAARCRPYAVRLRRHRLVTRGGRAVHGTRRRRRAPHAAAAHRRSAGRRRQGRDDRPGARHVRAHLPSPHRRHHAASGRGQPLPGRRQRCPLRPRRQPAAAPLLTAPALRPRLNARGRSHGRSVHECHRPVTRRRW